MEGNEFKGLESDDERKSSAIQEEIESKVEQESDINHDNDVRWHLIGDTSQLVEGDRLHTCVEGRYVTVFRNRSKLSCIDSICYHAGGPMTLGRLQDIEDLGGLTVVLCPWHKFMVTIDSGERIYQAVEFANGKPKPSGWRTGKVVQRPHRVTERDGSIFVALELSGEECSSDKDACNAHAAKPFSLTNPQSSFIE